MLINEKLKIYEFYIEPSLTDCEKNEIYEYLVSHNNTMLNLTNFRLTNFQILDHHYYFDKLYDQFQKCAENLFDKLTIIEPNKRCYAYVTSLNDKKSNLWHDHTKTSSINGVFYFSVPDENSGKLLFGNHNKEVIYEYQPKENYMLIFPDTLQHCPTHCKSERYRIAINMEIKCLEDVWNRVDQ